MTFHLTAVHFNDNTDVSGATVRADSQHLDFVQATLPGAKIPDVSPALITLTRSEVCDLFSAAGTVVPSTEASSRVYDQLTVVVYGLIDNEE